MSWIIASVPFWIMGGTLLLGAFASIQWKEPTTDSEATRVFGGLALAGILFYVAARIAS